MIEQMVFVIIVFIGIPLLIIIAFRGVKRLLGESKKEKDIRVSSELEYKNPDWVFYEKYLGREVNKELKWFYQETDISKNHVVKLKDYEVFIYPVHKDGIATNTKEVLGYNLFALAQSELGEPIFLKPNDHKQKDILFIYDRGSEKVKPFLSIKEFVSQFNTYRNTKVR